MVRIRACFGVFSSSPYEILESRAMLGYVYSLTISFGLHFCFGRSVIQLEKAQQRVLLHPKKPRPKGKKQPFHTFFKFFPRFLNKAPKWAPKQTPNSLSKHFPVASLSGRGLPSSAGPTGASSRAPRCIPCLVGKEALHGSARSKNTGHRAVFFWGESGCWKPFFVVAGSSKA